MNTKIKTSIIVGLLCISVFAAVPVATVKAQGPSINPENADKIFGQVGHLFEGMFAGAGAGAALGQVLSILFNNIWDFELQEFKDVKHVYILNATYTETVVENSTVEDYQTHWLWREKYNNDGAAWLGDEFPFITIERSGDINVTYEVGASIVFLIWDNNDSFITAINNLITAAKNVKAAFEDPEMTDEELAVYVSGQIVEALTYLFFHINDIINGDELIVMNMVTWESLTMETGANWEVTKQFGYRDWSTGDIEYLAPTDPIVTNWASIANDVADPDPYMQSLLTLGVNGSQTISWSKMTFNVIEIWLKTFQIHVNVDALMDMLVAAQGGEPLPEYAVYQVLQGFEIDIYIITHSLMGYIAYDDGAIGTEDGKPTITREAIQDTSSGETYDVINGSEAVYYFVPSFSANDVVFHEPEVTSSGDGVTWSIELQNVDMKAVPVGIGPYDTAGAGTNNLDYVELGFTFTPKLKETVDPDGYSGLAPDMDEVKMAASVLKLDQYFADWTGDITHLAGLDFAVIYVSTIIHFRLAFEIDPADEFDPALIDEGTTESGLVKTDSYHDETGEIKIGDETGNLPVAGVDIAGPGYSLGTDPTLYPASTTTIPLAWANYTATADATFVDVDNPANSFEVGGFLNIEAGIMIYAVSYPEFDGSGLAIWHDPTFSVFMTWDNPGFWAVILVVAGISLVAVAAILITRRKNRV